jgi:acyl-CoA dehydrogenase
MHFGLTDEQDMIVSTVRSFVEKEIYPHEAEVEHSGEVRAELANAIKQKTVELGVLRLHFLRRGG